MQRSKEEDDDEVDTKIQFIQRKKKRNTNKNILTCDMNKGAEKKEETKKRKEEKKDKERRSGDHNVPYR